jgi:hypothetical protein
MIARGISPRLAKLWGNRVFLGTGTRGVYAGTGYVVLSRTTATAQPRFGIVVAGANTAASVTVSGNDVTFNSATNGASAATSTVKDMVRAIQASRPASAVVSIQIDKGHAGSTVVSARALTTLAPQAV